MSFVGIIADCKDYEFIEKEISKIKKHPELINITEKNILNIKNVKFETIVICSNTDMNLSDILANAKYLILNSDVNITNINDNKLKIITYGLNQKSTVTASSISEDEVLVCLQRNIKDVKDNIIEVQETYMKSENITNKKVYSLMVIFILQQLYNSKN